MTTTAPVSGTQTFTITEEIAVRATLEQTFQSLIAQIGRLHETPEGMLIKFTLNHWNHHRGQLLVYLRLLNQSVPSVYGPTADENPFAA